MVEHLWKEIIIQEFLEIIIAQNHNLQRSYSPTKPVRLYDRNMSLKILSTYVFKSGIYIKVTLCNHVVSVHICWHLIFSGKKCCTSVRLYEPTFIDKSI